MSNRLLLLIFLYISIPCFAQNAEEDEKIAPDRPGFGDAVSIVSKGKMQIETGSWFEQDRTDKLNTLGFGINSTLFRLGLIKKVELRLDYNLWNSITPGNNGSELGLFPFRAGMKLHLLSNKGIIPTMTFIGMQELPFTATKNFRSDYLNTDLQLSFSNKVNDWFSLCYNLGATVNVSPSYYCALSSEFTFTEKLGYYFQAHGHFQKVKSTNSNYATSYLQNFETGFMYYPNRNAQIDISGGLKARESIGNETISVQQHSWFFVTVGFSWRFALRADKRGLR